MNHHTKDKGDIGLTKVIADLVEKGFKISLPLHEHLQYDLIADFEGKLIRVQTKFRYKQQSKKSISFKCATTHRGHNGKVVERKYLESDFELYAIYSLETKLCYYVPNVGQNSITICESFSQSYTYVYWYEDFLDPLISKLPQKRKSENFANFNPPALKNLKHSSLKVKNRPNCEQLQEEIKKYGYCGTGRKYGVSDNAIRKWEKKYNVEITK